MKRTKSKHIKNKRPIFKPITKQHNLRVLLTLATELSANFRGKYFQLIKQRFRPPHGTLSASADGICHFHKLLPIHLQTRKQPYGLVTNYPAHNILQIGISHKLFSREGRSQNKQQKFGTTP